MDRVETGPVQFEDDWPGVFIRGDNAIGYRFAVMAAIHAAENGEQLNPIYMAQLKGLKALLASSQVGAGKPPEGLQIVLRAPAEPGKGEEG